MISAQNHRQPLNGNKFRFVFLGIFLFSSMLNAQTIDCEQGKTHYVEKGQTIYGISKQYQIAQEDLLRCNPNVANEGLKVGTIIKIPLKQSSNGEGASQNMQVKEFIIHPVKPKETIYGISKTYGITQEQLIKLNPELEYGLKVGMELKVPTSSHAGRIPNKDEQLTAKDSNSQKETGREDLEKSTDDEAESNKWTCKALSKSERAQVYKIALLLPFHSVSQERFNPRSKIGIDFYQGVKYALDSLRSEGLFAQLYVFDTQNDTNTVRELIRRGELDQMNLIIGPLFNSLFVQVAEFAKKKKIPIVSPFVQADAIIRNNPYAIKVTPDQEMLAMASASYLKNNYRDSEILLVANLSEKDKNIIKHFKEAFTEAGLQFKQITYTSFNEVAQAINDLKQTIVVFPSTAQAQVYDFVARLNGIRQKNIILFGLNEWNNFENMEYQYLDNLKFHYASPTMADFSSEASLRFQNIFREEFKTEASTFALHGFDVGYYFFNALLNYGTDFYKCLPNFPEYHGLNLILKFSQLNKQSGFENSGVFIVRIEDLMAKNHKRNE